MATQALLGQDAAERGWRGSQRSLAVSVVSQDVNFESEGQPETTPWHYAAGTGNLEALHECLVQAEKIPDFDIDEVDPYGRTALIYTVAADAMGCTQLLLSVGASLDAVDADGRTALHWSAFHGKHKMLKFLIAQRAAVGVKDNEGRSLHAPILQRSPLHLCMSPESSKCAKQLVKYLPPEGLDETDKEGMTALHWGALNERVKHIDLLINAGASLGIQDREGKSGLHWTATNEDVICCSQIISASPEVQQLVDLEGRSALHLAVAERNFNIVNCLTSAPGCQIDGADTMQRTPAIWAAVFGHGDILHLLLERGANPAAADDIGAKALHYASQHEDTTSLQVLLSQPGSEDLPDAEGRTAVMWAAAQGSVEGILLLGEAGCDIHAADNAGATALHTAALAGHNDCVVFLLQLGASVAATDAQGQTPLFRACEVGHAEVVATLVHAGAQTDARDGEGQTALHGAALGGHEYICLQLIQAGAEQDPRDNNGRTPLQCGAYGGHLDTISMFLQQGADVNAADSEGITALHWASSRGKLDAVKLLCEYGALPNQMEVDGDRLTALDYATIGDGQGTPHQEVVQYLESQGALSIHSLRHMAATYIQQWYRGSKGRQGSQAAVSTTSTAARSATKTRAGNGGTGRGRGPRPRGKGGNSNTAAPSKKKASSNSSKPKPTQQPPMTSPTRGAGETAIETEPAPVPRRNFSELLSESASAKDLAQRERRRLSGIREKVDAAETIQAAWQRHTQRQRSPCKVTRAAAETFVVDRNSREQQIAALTIQLAWRQHAGRDLRKRRARERKPQFPNILSQAQKRRVSRVYLRDGNSRPAKYRPKRRSMSRPAASLYRTSPAVKSFNFAVDSYQPPMRRSSSGSSLRRSSTSPLHGIKAH